jgi:ankyrin repeat protein
MRILKEGSNRKELEKDLFTAILFDNLKKVKDYLRKGVDINIQDEEGDTPLIASAVFGFTDIAKYLVDMGAKIDIKNNRGETALQASIRFDRIETMNFLKTL